MNPILPIEELLLIFLPLAALGVWTSWRSSTRAPRPRRVALLCLRVLGIGALFVIALNPGRWSHLGEEEIKEWTVLIDSSASMATKDVAGESRHGAALELARKLAEKETGEAPVRFHSFADKLSEAIEPDQLAEQKPDGEKTDVAQSLDELFEQYSARAKPLAGVVMLTDGRQVPDRAMEAVAMRARAGASPVYPLVLGEAVKSPDLMITVGQRQQIAFAGQPLTLSARVTARHLQLIRPVVQLINEENAVVDEKKLVIGSDGRADARFELDEITAGYRRWKVRVQPWAGETISSNNEAEFAVVGLEKKIRVLFVEGAPYWDSKFIAQLLQRQDNVELTLIYRLTRERYFSLSTSDERLNVSTLPTFPEKTEAIGAFDLIVVGKGFEYFLNQPRIAALTGFVREHGGALLFARGKPYNGELDDLETLEPVSWERPWSGEFQWQPTALGESAGLFDGRLPGRDDAIWNKLPELTRAWNVGRQKAFSQILAEGSAHFGQRERKLPVVVSHRFGRGLVVTVNSEDLWQWDFFPRFAGASDLYRDFWLQLVNWSVVHADFLPGHDWALRTSSTAVKAGEPFRLHLMSRGESTGATPRLRLVRGKQVMGDLPPSPVPGRPGEWEAIATIESPGLVTARLESGEADAVYSTVRVAALPTEADNLSPNPDAMDRLADLTEGRVITVDDLDQLLQPDNTPPPTTTHDARWDSAWDEWHWLLLALLPFGLEWFLRRRAGLT